MRFKASLSLIIGLLFCFLCFSQYGKQKRADDYFNNFSYVKAIEVYKDLVKNDYNKDYATRRLAECYSMLGDLENAVVYYEEIVKQPNVPEEYYYNYAQALRSIGKYDESREWLKKFRKAGGKDNLTGNLKESNLSTSVFNAKPQYYISEVPFNSKYSDFGAFQINGKIYFSALGSTFNRFALSSSDNNRFPPSNGIFPKLILGTEQIGFVLFSIKISLASNK